jgi:hypothetical protein
MRTSLAVSLILVSLVSTASALADGVTNPKRPLVQSVA